MENSGVWTLEGQTQTQVQMIMISQQQSFSHPCAKVHQEAMVHQEAI